MHLEELASGNGAAELFGLRRKTTPLARDVPVQKKTANKCSPQGQAWTKRAMPLWEPEEIQDMLLSELNLIGELTPVRNDPITGIRSFGSNQAEHACNTALKPIEAPRGWGRHAKRE